MPSEEKYMEFFRKGGKLIDGLLRLDGQKSPKLSFFQKRKLRKAKELYELASVESPENAAPFLMLAKIEERLGDHKEALAWLQKSWLLEPGNLILTIELSGAYGLVGKHQEAISVLLEGRKHYPNEPRILFNLGISFLLIGQAKAAVDIFLNTIEIEPDYEMNHKILAYSKDVVGGIKPLPKDQSDIARNIS